jgi:hypothetical protein
MDNKVRTIQSEASHKYSINCIYNKFSGENTGQYSERIC